MGILRTCINPGQGSTACLRKREEAMAGAQSEGQDNGSHRSLKAM